MVALRDVGDRNSEDFRVDFDLGVEDWAEVCVCCAAADLSDVDIGSGGCGSCGLGNTFTREYTGTVMVLEDTVVVVEAAVWDLSVE